MSDHLILLHGLWMRGIALLMLRRRFESEGFEVDVFDYLSVAAPLERTLERLRKQLRETPGTVHVVGHSLGGLVALRACRGQDDLPPGRIVCMGSPLNGSASAQRLAEAGGAWMLGHSKELLEHGLQRWDGKREVGVIAGSKPVGLGAALGSLEGDHDGSVAVSETRLPGIRDHCVVTASHSGLIFSAEAAAQAVRFLRQGRFEHAHDKAGVETVS
ncbi:alpha/beta hydrolase [Oleiagrimonas citrea]|jgi:hypothetical protein|uniref:Alpha/beta fold hydrolase n=1 Tax=Oleiagrimonas citrea TaxID=1665687 RepID=A0A846ZMY2_9GAMM|nr:alpha/beta fold hydrolase [Oleiagrimonas citrea]NKZ39564.1 alpha/beta fold hydrolase [Oleiagrimonas citrea]